MSSRDYAGRDKAEALRELFGRALMRVDLWACQDAVPLDFHVTLMPLGAGTAAYAYSEHTPAHFAHRPAHIGAGADDLLLTTTQDGCTIRSAGGDLEIPAGGFVLHSKARAHEFIHRWGGRTASLQLPRATLAARVPGLEEAPLRRLHAGMPEPALARAFRRPCCIQPDCTCRSWWPACCWGLGSQARVRPRAMRWTCRVWRSSSATSLRASRNRS
jgi:hypothetical protein